MRFSRIATGAALLLFLALCLPLSSRTAAADEIRLHNGDRLTGKVLSAQNGKLVIDTPHAGKISVAMEEIAAVTTDEPVTLRLGENEVLTGKIATRDGEVRILSNERRTDTGIAWQQVRSINVADTLWDGGVFLGGTHQAGNTQRTGVSFGAEATRRSRNDRYTLSFLYNYAEEDGELTTRDTYGAIKYDYFFTQKFYGLLSVELLKDKFKDLNLRAIVGPGVGYQIWEDDIKALALEAGVAYFSEDRVEADDEQWFTARLAAIARYQLTPWLKVTEHLILYPQLESFGDYTLRNEATLITSLGAAWSLRLANIWERDSNPAQNVKKDDFKSSVNLQYSF